MADKIAVSWGGRVHISNGIDIASDLVGTFCGKKKPFTTLKANGDYAKVPQQLRCAECDAAYAEVMEPTAVVALPGYLADMLVECEWRAAMDARIDAAAKTERWS